MSGAYEFSTNTHYGVVVFGGDFDNDHPDPLLRGESPHMELIACGGEEHCWDALRDWLTTHPLRRDEHAEVLTRDLSAVKAQ
jgi:hypothetical protein